MKLAHKSLIFKEYKRNFSNYVKLDKMEMQQQINSLAGKMSKITGEIEESHRNCREAGYEPESVHRFQEETKANVNQSKLLNRSISKSLSGKEIDVTETLKAIDEWFQLADDLIAAQDSAKQTLEQVKAKKYTDQENWSVHKEDSFLVVNVAINHLYTHIRETLTAVKDHIVANADYLSQAGENFVKDFEEKFGKLPKLF